jgi:hypothetical protein
MHEKNDEILFPRISRAPFIWKKNHLDKFITPKLNVSPLGQHLLVTSKSMPSKGYCFEEVIWAHVPGANLCSLSFTISPQ